MTYYPMLAKQGDISLLNELEWQYEIKLDGVRCIAVRENGRVTLTSRTGQDITSQFPDVANRITYAPTDCVLDGEIIPVGDGNFQKLQTRLQRKVFVTEFVATCPCTFVAFDVLKIGDVDLTSEPLHVRRSHLERLRCVQFDLSQVINAYNAGRVISDAKLEGVMAKRYDSKYYYGYRSGDWRKIKPTRQLEVIIGGCTWGTGRRATKLGALLVGVPKEDSQNDLLWYRGSVGTGLTDEMLNKLTGLLDSSEIDDSPFMDFPLNNPQANSVRGYCKPELRCVVEYQELTRDGYLRFPSFKRLVDATT